MIYVAGLPLGVPSLPLVALEAAVALGVAAVLALPLGIARFRGAIPRPTPPTGGNACAAEPLGNRRTQGPRPPSKRRGGRPGLFKEARRGNETGRFREELPRSSACNNGGVHSSATSPTTMRTSPSLIATASPPNSGFGPRPFAHGRLVNVLVHEVLGYRGGDKHDDGFLPGVGQLVGQALLELSVQLMDSALPHRQRRANVLEVLGLPSRSRQRP